MAHQHEFSGHCTALLRYGDAEAALYSRRRQIVRASGGQILQRLDRDREGSEVRCRQRAQIAQHLLPALECRVARRRGRAARRAARDR